MASPWLLVAFCLSAVLLIPLDLWIPGLVVWGGVAVFAFRSGDPTIRRIYGVLLGAILILPSRPSTRT